MRQSLKQTASERPEAQEKIALQPTRPKEDFDFAIRELKHLVETAKGEMVRARAASDLARILAKFQPAPEPTKTKPDSSSDAEPLTPAKLLEWASRLAIMLEASLRQGEITVAQVRESMASLLRMLDQNPR